MIRHGQIVVANKWWQIVVEGYSCPASGLMRESHAMPDAMEVRDAEPDDLAP